MSHQLRQCIAEFLNHVEATGHWPEKVATALIHLIAKADGGRIRKPIVQEWARQHARPYGWATQGSSSEAAA